MFIKAIILQTLNIVGGEYCHLELAMEGAVLFHLPPNPSKTSNLYNNGKWYYKIYND